MGDFLVVRTEQGNGVGCVLQSHADGSANVQWLNSTDLQSNPRRTWSFSWESPGANKFGERVGPDHRNEMACWDRVSRENMVKKSSGGRPWRRTRRWRGAYPRRPATTSAATEAAQGVPRGQLLSRQLGHEILASNGSNGPNEPSKRHLPCIYCLGLVDLTASWAPLSTHPTSKEDWDA